VLLVPELPYTTIAQPAERPDGRRTPIGGENRLPDREHADIGFRMLLEDLFDCGGPPQTGRSRWRQQKDDSYLVRSAVEFFGDGVERSRPNCRQWRLTLGHTAGVLVPLREPQEDQS